MLVYLITGKAGSGKDTVGKIMSDILVDSYSVALGDAVKELAKSVYKWDCIKDADGRKLLITVGHYLGKGYNYVLGKERYGYRGENITAMYYIFREYYTPDVNLWASIVFDKIMVRRPDNVIITDCRYRSEVLYFKNRFPKVVVIRVVENERTDFIEHPSETDLDDYNWDHAVLNNGDLVDLKGKVEAILEQYV